MFGSPPTTFARRASRYTNPWGFLVHLRTALLAIFVSIPVFAQVQTGPSVCSLFTSPPLIRAEGITERIGDLTLQCSFTTPPPSLTGNLAVFLPVQVTNAINANNLASDAVLLANTGSGFAATATPATVMGNTVTFYGVNVPVPPGGQVSLRISGIRVNAAQVNGSGASPIYASVSFNVPMNQSQLIVAYVQKSLFSTTYSTGITCYGSPLPGSITLSNLFSAGTALASTRFTEAFSGAFQPRGSGDSNGTRFLVQYSGFPTQTQVYLPDFVAGNDAAVPTSGGDLGIPEQVGQYVPGSGTLLLARVIGADSTGTGGSPMALPVNSGPGPVLLNSASPMTLTNGAGYAVYEVVDANPAARESVQFPTFVGLSNVTAAAVAQETVSYAPVSTVLSASQTAPVPRFVSTVPGADCSIVGDCQAGYFPKLDVQTSVSKFQTTATAGGNTTEVPGEIFVGNDGGGDLNYVININYLNGSNWLLLDYPTGNNNATVRVWAKPQNLTPGTYTANLVVSGDGPTSAPVTIPITVVVQAAPPPPPTPTPVTTPAPAVSLVVNAASLTAAPLVAGSLATVMGSNLSGKTVTVTFDGTPAYVFYDSATQINLQVPTSLDPSKSTSSLVVNVDGNASAPVTVSVAKAGPAIFNGGVLNQDYSQNSPTAPAGQGNVLQIFATGIPGGATVTVQMGGLSQLIPLYAAGAPGLTGIQQVDIAVPANLGSGAVPLAICASEGQQQYCSSNYTVYLK